MLNPDICQDRLGTKIGKTQKRTLTCSVVVFIGVGLNKPLMMEKLTEALLTEKESEELGGVQGWAELQDPFFGGDAAKSFMDLPERFKQQLAQQGQQQHRHASSQQQMFESVFNWEQTANIIHIHMCAQQHTSSLSFTTRHAASTVFI